MIPKLLVIEGESREKSSRGRRLEDKVDALTAHLQKDILRFDAV